MDSNERFVSEPVYNNININIIKYLQCLYHILNSIYKALNMLHLLIHSNTFKMVLLQMNYKLIVKYDFLLFF